MNTGAMILSSTYEIEPLRPRSLQCLSVTRCRLAD